MDIIQNDIEIQNYLYQIFLLNTIQIKVLI